MIDLDEMKQKWAEHDRKLDESIRLNRQLVRDNQLGGVWSNLQRMMEVSGIGAAIWLVIIAALGRYIFDHHSELRFAVPAAALDVYCISMLVATIRLIAGIQQVDYSRPVTAIQKQLEGLRRLRIRTTQWGMIAGTVLWAPFAIVTSQVLFGLDSYSLAWLGANIAFGLAMIPLFIWISKTFGDRMQQSPFMQQLMRDVSGRNLSAAVDFTAKLAEFDKA
jgi:hypothetical protein